MNEQNWISGKLVIALVVVTALAMLAFLGLSAYAPQLRTETAGRPNVLSKSAIGFAGLRLLLEATKTPVLVNRDRSRDEDDNGLYILTPDLNTSGQAVANLANDRPGPVLIILPKWPAIPNPFHSGWVIKLEAYSPSTVAGVLKGLEESSHVQQVRPPQDSAKKAAVKDSKVQPKPAPKPKKPSDWKAPPVTIAGTSGFGTSPFPAKLAIDNFQTVSGKKWIADLTDGHGRAVLAHLKGTKIYVLSDPDLANTAGLKNEAVAKGILTLIARIQESDYASFDVTLAGFDTPPSLLHAIFAPPFLAATACALLAAFLMAFHALNRFGTPLPEDRAFAFGKKSLADNTAGLIRVMRRGPGMAPRYAAAVRRIAARALRRGKTEDVDWLDAVERASRLSPTYGEMLAEAGTVSTEPQLMRLADKLYAWKSKITHDRKAWEKRGGP